VNQSTNPAIAYERLRVAACRLLEAAGAEPSVAHCVAQALIEADLLGHDTHGLALLGAYVDELKKGSMRASGQVEVLRERASVALWDGHRMAGPWLVQEAMRWGLHAAKQHGAAHVVVRRSHHIAALAAYLEAPARAGFLVHLCCSDPNTTSVAPFGGTRAVITPNPMAWAWPCDPDPVIIDVSASITTNGMSARLSSADTSELQPYWPCDPDPVIIDVSASITTNGMSARLSSADTSELQPYAWWLDAAGNPTKDPGVLQSKPAGSILPLGGMEAGHKGFGLGLMVEAMTAGLAAHGRADPPEGWGASLHVQVLDPEAFGGLAGFEREMNQLAAQCRASPSPAGKPGVRMPGERGLQRKRKQLNDGIELHPSILPSLERCAQSLGFETFLF